jgi:hypothetical protein
MAVSQALLDAFARFWLAYPARPDNPKAAAREVFVRRCMGGADPEAIILAAGRYAKRVSADALDAAFIPHARTWISQRRYEDYLEEAPASAAEPAQPSPEHPLAWLEPDMGEARWASWIKPLQLELAEGRPATIIAQTQFALDHVRAEWGYLIRARYGRDVAWAVKRKD